MNQLARAAYRAALWALVVIVVASAFATIPLVQGASPNYTLTGYVSTPSGAPVPNGVTVDLVSRATGAVYTASTSGGGGQFVFTTSSTSSALGPGYWGLSVPAEGNVSLPHCSPCAILPQEPTPTFAFYTASELTSSSFSVEVGNVKALVYNATISGIVHDGPNLALGTPVQLLDPHYTDLILYGNTTNRSTGAYSLKAPWGTYVVQSRASGLVDARSNDTEVAVGVSNPNPSVNPTIQSYLASGRMRTSSGGFVNAPGNATLYDPYNHYLYSMTTAPGGYYALGTYANFTAGGPQPFEAILSSAGYSTSAYAFTVTPSTPGQSRNVNLASLAPAQTGSYQTTLDFTGFDPATGTGSLGVTTVAALGNDSVFGNLPNASVGQMWAQLGLNFAHSISFPSSDLSQVWSWENSTGPFFPAVQAGTAINGTGFLGPAAPEKLASVRSDCSGTCGVGSSATMGLTWSETYALNGTLFANSSSYSASFNFRHPTTGGDVYNYTVELPAGYVLKAGTTPPTNTQLAAAGAGGTWNKFVLESLYNPTGAGSFSFQFLRTSTLTAIVNASVSNFAFSSHNVLNQTNGNYTVVVGLGQNVSFTAIHSIYPAGTNGTRFAWTFGDSSGTQTTTNGSGYHIYTAVTGATPYTGTLNVTSSGGFTDQTVFHVWVGNGPVTAGIASNATAAQTKTTAGGTTYLYVNWSSILRFNATLSHAVISAGGPSANISVASYQMSAWGGFSTTIANFSVAQGSSFLAFQNTTYQFLGGGSYLSAGRVNGSSVPFKGWQYNLTLTVWSATGTKGVTTLTILVNDTEKPVSAFRILDTNYRLVSGKGIVAGSNLSALVRLDGGNASDPHNGSISHYYWHIWNTGNTSFHVGLNVSSVNPYPTVWLSAQSTAYTVNLTVTDANGNLGWTTQSLSVTQNTTTTPVMYASDLTGPNGNGSQTLNEGTSYTFWVNVTTKSASGSSAVAKDIVVSFYVTSPGSTSKRSIDGSPSSVKFYNYTSSGIVNDQIAIGSLASLGWNQTVRAVISWNPGFTGNYDLYANITASNMFVVYPPTTSVASVSVTINPNPTTQLLEYVAIGVAVVVVIGLIVVYYRRRSRGGATRPGRSAGRSGLERGSRRSDEEDDED